MNEYVCNHAAIRFLPYRETSEFVNIGLIAHCPQIGFFGSRLAKRRSRRVGGFFPEMDPHVFTAAVDALRSELLKYRNDTGLFTEGRVLTPQEADQGVAAFRRLTRRREGLVHFGERPVPA
jgi:hypothetical protein